MLQALRLPAICLALAALFTSSAAHAAWEEIQNVESAPIPAGISAEKIKRAMITGGSRRGWVITEEAAGHLLATLNIRSHTVRVDIHFDPGTYSLTYRDSENMKFKKGKIHSNYNKWVRNLNADIQQALALVAL